MSKVKEWSSEKKRFVRFLAFLLVQNGEIDVIKDFKELKLMSPVLPNMSVNDAEKVLIKYFS